MKRLVLFSFVVSCFFINNALSSDFLKVQGQFLTEEGDSLDLVKKQLIYEASTDAISKKIEEMGLNKTLFWQKHIEKIEKKNLELESRLKAQYRITESSSMRDLEKYSKSLRLKKLLIKRKIGNFKSVIQSYVIKKMSRSPQNKNLRYIKMEMKVNEKKLTKIYYQLVRGKKESEFGSLYLSTTYNLKNVAYSDFGIKNENDFTGVILNNWVSWFVKNKAANISNIEELSENGLAKLRELEKMPFSEAFHTMPSDFVNSLLLDIKVSIIKKKFNPRLKEYEFLYSARAFLKDIQSGLIIGEYNLGESLKSYRLEDGVSLVNIVANHVYRMVSGHFPRINRAIKDFPPITNIQKVTFSGFKSMTKVFKLLELIRNKGVRYSVRTSLLSFTDSSASGVFYYDGQLPDIKALLMKIKAAKKGLYFDLIDTDKGLGIKLR